MSCSRDFLAASLVALAALGAGTAHAAGFLVDSRGMTVYVYDIDRPGVSNCYDACAQAWPPVLDGGSALPEGYSVVTRRDGTRQLAFDQRPLYTFVGDAAPGQTHGDGLDGVWHIVAQGSALARAALAPARPQPVVRVSITGHAFTQVTDRPELGDAWMDESGLVWGDAVSVKGLSDRFARTCVQNQEGFCEMPQPQAIDYCESIGAELPTQDQFVQLDRYLGDSSVTMDINGNFLQGQAKTEMIPHLTTVSYWSSTLNEDVPDLAAHVFSYGADAELQIHDNDVINDYLDGGSSLIRCVERR